MPKKNAIPGTERKEMARKTLDPGRIFERYEENEKGCWIWQGALTSMGYGNATIHGKQTMVHRLAYELKKGLIPAGLDIDHVCRNPACINPKHLEAVTRKENVRRGTVVEALLKRHRERTHCSKGHELSGNNLYPHITRKICRLCKNDANRRTCAKARAKVKARLAKLDKLEASFVNPSGK